MKKSVFITGLIGATIIGCIFGSSDTTTNNNTINLIQNENKSIYSTSIENKEQEKLPKTGKADTNEIQIEQPVVEENKDIIEEITENPQPEITQPVEEIKEESIPVSKEYILNTNTKKFHKPSCSSVSTIKDSNREEFSGTRDELISRGYDSCKRCNP